MSLFHDSDQFDFVSSQWCVVELGRHYANQTLLCIFVLRNTTGLRVKFVDSEKYF